jgi:hypothetical protein
MTSSYIDWLRSRLDHIRRADPGHIPAFRDDREGQRAHLLEFAGYEQPWTRARRGEVAAIQRDVRHFVKSPAFEFYIAGGAERAPR